MSGDSKSPRHRIGSYALLVGACGYSLYTATTTPFTTSANIVTGIPILAMAVLVVIRWPLRTGSIRPTRLLSFRPYLPWLVVVIVLSGWEAFNYVVHGSRADHPTFSSMADAVTRYYGLKALCFLAFLYICWTIVVHGARFSAEQQDSA